MYQEEELKSNYTEVRRLKGVIARQKQGPTLTETDLKAGGRNVLDTVIDGLPTNYKKLAKKYKHLVEPLIINEDGQLKPEVTALNRIISFSRIYNKLPSLAETKIILKDLLNAVYAMVMVKYTETI